MLGLLAGLFVGWGLGANNGAASFGTAVSSHMIRWRTAAILASVFVFAGAVLQGRAGIETLSGLTEQTNLTAGITVLAAGITIAVLTFMRLPASVSQAVVGAIVGLGIIKGNMNFASLGKVVACWIGTPVGAAILFVVFYHLLRGLHNWWKPSVFQLDPVLRGGLLLCGCYGAYALGANNVANVTGVFVGKGMLSMNQAVVIGGLSICLGIVTYSLPVMMTVGDGLIKMDSFSAFVVVLSQSVTVHVYALLGVPVSSSQAIVGAVLGISLVKGLHTVKWGALRAVGLGWVFTPIVAGLLACLAYFVANLKYVP